MSKRSPALLVDDILQSCQKLVAYTETMTYEDFIADPKTMDAVIRNVEDVSGSIKEDNDPSDRG
jgi:uncharacterized protein with HEPN domain